MTRVSHILRRALAAAPQAWVSTPPAAGAAAAGRRGRVGGVGGTGFIRYVASASASSSSAAAVAAAATAEPAGAGDEAGWETIVGLELHVQVAANTKLFSGYATEPTPRAKTHGFSGCKAVADNPVSDG
jgi:hypothetical protein